MIAIVTPDEMREIDAHASVPEAVLIERAGAAVARSALDLLGGSYGRRVVVVVGKGNNGNDGRVAARRLRERGVRVVQFDATSLPVELPVSDLVIDAAYGTGFRGGWEPPAAGAAQGGARVLAVDIPTGIDGLTGAAGLSRPWQAERTVTFAALKPGLVLGDGATLAGHVHVADIGLDVSSARAHLVTRDDVAQWVPARDVTAHKWSSAVCVIAGSAGMTGAAELAASAAQRGGAGMVRLGIPGARLPLPGHREAVGVALGDRGWATDALAAAHRCHALVIGPGLHRADETLAAVRHVVAACPLPTVIDGDGLFALGWGRDGVGAVIRDREEPTVLTPHDGEFTNLLGRAPGPDRFDAARMLAERTGAIVLLKGPVTIVAEPSGAALAVSNGDQRLATAGTGDVLAGLVGAFLAANRASTTTPLQSVAAAAYVHGLAANLGPAVGLVASDMVALLPAAFSMLAAFAPGSGESVLAVDPVTTSVQR